MEEGKEGVRDPNVRRPLQKATRDKKRKSRQKVQARAKLKVEYCLMQKRTGPLQRFWGLGSGSRQRGGKK